MSTIFQDANQPLEDVTNQMDVLPDVIPEVRKKKREISGKNVGGRVTRPKENVKVGNQWTIVTFLHLLHVLSHQI
jgi:hypothetical protein